MPTVACFMVVQVVCACFVMSVARGVCVETCSRLGTFYAVLRLVLGCLYACVVFRL